jgi:threonine/homoserine/homoserine lactone efflux protein
MNTAPFITGLIIGITMAAPIGPISLLAIRRSLTRGHHAGIATALGVALADGFYAIIAAFGITAISSFLLHNRGYLDLFGGTILLLLGLKAFKAEPITAAAAIKSRGFISTLIQTALLTLANPMTIITFVAAFAAVGFQGRHEWREGLMLSFGVFCGSALWFIGLSTLVSSFRTRITPTVLTIINKISGIFLMAFGAYFIYDALHIMGSYLLHY